MGVWRKTHSGKTEMGVRLYTWLEEVQDGEGGEAEKFFKLLFLYLYHLEEASSRYCVIPGGKPSIDSRVCLPQARGYGVEDLNLGLLHQNQVCYYWFELPLNPKGRHDNVFSRKGGVGGERDKKEGRVQEGKVIRWDREWGEGIIVIRSERGRK